MNLQKNKQLIFHNLNTNEKTIPWFKITTKFVPQGIQKTERFE